MNFLVLSDIVELCSFRRFMLFHPAHKLGSLRLCTF